MSSMSKLKKLLNLAIFLGTFSSASVWALPGEDDFVMVGDATEVLDFGLGLYETGMYKQAMAQFESVLLEDPANDRANYLMGLSHMGLDAAAEAIPFFERALSRNNFMYAAREQLGLALLKSGDAEAAEKHLGTLSRQQARCGDACDDLLNTAVQSLKSALEHKDAAAATGSLWQQPEQQLALQDSITAIHQHNYPHAIALLKQTLASTGDHPDILNYLGFSHRKLGLYEQAIAYYRQALAIDPAHLGANEYLGELYVEIGDLDRASMQLARLDQLCAFACYEREELARWIAMANGSVNLQAMLQRN